MTYSNAFNLGIGFVLPHENEYLRGHWGDPKFVITENVTGDRGGLTKYGVDQASNPGVDIANLNQDGATVIYWNKYWLPHNLDSLPAALAIASFDVWVNGGHAVLWLQHALNATNLNSSLVEDGVMGLKTIQAASVCSQSKVVSLFLSQRDARFKAIVSNNPSQQKFLSGWLQRDIDLANYLTHITT